MYAIAQSLGDLMRQNPLPAGRYWLDVFDPNRGTMTLWVNNNAGSVTVQDLESFPAVVGGGITMTDQNYPARDFYIFTVSSPVSWDAVTFGYPTIAASNVNSSDDTVQEPSVESTSDLLKDAATTVTKIAFWCAVVVGGVLVLKTADTVGLFRSKS
jgi:hypothetical protein